MKNQTNMEQSILIIEDDEDTCDLLRKALAPLGAVLSMTHEGGEAINRLRADRVYDLVLLDIMLQEVDGFQIAKELNRLRIPFIMISMRTLPADVVQGLEAGAQDYIRKPFHPEEVLARVKRVLEQPRGETSSRPITFANDEKTVTIRGEAATLTPIEYRLFEALYREYGHFVSTKQLIEMVWSDQMTENPYEAIRLAVRRLRKKIEPDPARPSYILNKWGSGYKLDVGENE